MFPDFPGVSDPTVLLLPHFQWAEVPTVCLFVSTFSVG